MKTGWARWMNWTNHSPLLRRVKLELKCIFGKQIRPQVRVNRKRLLIGTSYQVAWIIDPTLLNSNSIVYCGGVGTDISFDKSLIHQFGLEVHAFDPTPECIEWLKQNPPPDRFHFHPVGLANYDGTAEFNESGDGDYDISRSSFRGVGAQRDIVPVNRISTLMNELGHTHLDLLKIDIEGFEYGVIDDLLKSKIPIKQLLVEFHHRWPEIGHEKTNKAIEQLDAVGLRVFAVSGMWDEYSFVKV